MADQKPEQGSCQGFASSSPRESIGDVYKSLSSISMKELLLDAICGVNFPNIHIAIYMEGKALAKFTGNQWGENWAWDREAVRKKFERLPVANMAAFYMELKRHQGFGVLGDVGGEVSNGESS